MAYQPDPLRLRLQRRDARHLHPLTMAKQTQRPSKEWLLSLSKDDHFDLLAWLFAAALTKGEVAAEFANYQEWQAKRDAAATTEH
jgi:hypothetical protein